MLETIAASDSKNTLLNRSSFKTEFKSAAIVIPMYNEIDSIPLLSYRLKGVMQILSDHIVTHLVIVDDGSTDMTFQEIRTQFNGMENVHLIRHWRNMGYSKALRTGIDKALELNAELIVTIDADTNYDHFYIPMFIDFFPDNCDLMTASPFHPGGQSKYFPRHRLILSLGLSWCYRNVLRDFKQPLYTYSSCFRVAKADVYRKIKWDGKDFMANSEIIARCIINGFNVKELPFQMNPRWFGMSKMRKYRQLIMHLKFLWKVWRNPGTFKIFETPKNLNVTFHE